MAGILHYSAQNQNNAGITTAETVTPTAHAASPTELFHNVFSSDMGGLGHLFGHGVEHVVATPLEVASDSVRTTLGGLSRATRLNGPAMAHPIDGDHTIGTELNTSVPRFSDTIRLELSRLRGVLGI
jgi:hypothetical protein